MQKKYIKETFEKWVKLDSNSVTGLKWVAPRYFRGGPNFDRVGTAAGHVVKNHGRDSYWNLRLDGKDYLVHRIVWVLTNGHIPNGLQVDHLDQNGLNNSIDNLRIVSASVNSKNKPKKVDNSSGFTGVNLECAAGKCGYRASAVIGGKLSRRFYSFSKYGKELSFKLACEYRESMIKLDNDYTKIHGKDI